MKTEKMVVAETVMAAVNTRHDHLISKIDKAMEEWEVLVVPFFEKAGLEKYYQIYGPFYLNYSDCDFYKEDDAYYGNDEDDHFDEIFLSGLSIRQLEKILAAIPFTINRVLKEAQRQL